jgi:hypothetical protein
MPYGSGAVLCGLRSLISCLTAWITASKMWKSPCTAWRRTQQFMFPLPGVYAGPSGRAVWGVGLRPLACWDCGFESQRGDGCLLSDRGLCDELITRPEEPYRVWCVCVWSRNLVNEEALAQWGLLRHRQTKLLGVNNKPFIDYIYSRYDVLISW